MPTVLPSSIDPKAYTAFAQASLAVTSAEDFRMLVRQHVRPLLPAQMLLAVVARLHLEHAEIHKMVSVDFPQEFLDQVPKISNLRDRRAAAKWLETRNPVVVDPRLDHQLLSPMGQREADAYDFQMMGIHGVMDVSSNMGSYFSFCRIDFSASRHDIVQALKLICPLLHTALISLPDLEVCTVNPMTRLTQLERQMLQWLAAGRSNTEIAQLRGRSPTTVRNQLEALYKKLNADNRAQAVSVALSFGLT